MQDALGGKAIHAALRSLTNICSGLLNCGAESVPSGCNVRYSDLARTLSSLSFRSRNVGCVPKPFQSREGGCRTLPAWSKNRPHRP